MKPNPKLTELNFGLVLSYFRFSHLFPKIIYFFSFQYSFLKKLRYFRSNSVISIKFRYFLFSVNFSLVFSYFLFCNIFFFFWKLKPNRTENQIIFQNLTEFNRTQNCNRTKNLKILVRFGSAGSVPTENGTSRPWLIWTFFWPKINVRSAY